MDDDDPGWQYISCLYAYLSPDENQILYVGKSWGKTVKERWNSKDKVPLWTYIEKELGFKEHVLLIGEIYMNEDNELTKELLTDIESLIINIEKPLGNIMCIDTRISRPGLVVKCDGLWPGELEYVDE